MRVAKRCGSKALIETGDGTTYWLARSFRQPTIVMGKAYIRDGVMRAGEVVTGWPDLVGFREWLKTLPESDVVEQFRRHA